MNTKYSLKYINYFDWTSICAAIFKNGFPLKFTNSFHSNILTARGSTSL